MASPKKGPERSVFPLRVPTSSKNGWLFIGKAWKNMGGVIDLRHPPYHILNKTILSLGDN